MFVRIEDRLCLLSSPRQSVVGERAQLRHPRPRLRSWRGMLRLAGQFVLWLLGGGAILAVGLLIFGPAVGPPTDFSLRQPTAPVTGSDHAQLDRARGLLASLQRQIHEVALSLAELRAEEMHLLQGPIEAGHAPLSQRVETALFDAERQAQDLLGISVDPASPGGAKRAVKSEAPYAGTSGLAATAPATGAGYPAATAPPVAFTWSFLPVRVSGATPATAGPDATGGGGASGGGRGGTGATVGQSGRGASSGAVGANSGGGAAVNGAGTATGGVSSGPGAAGTTGSGVGAGGSSTGWDCWDRQ